MHLLEQNLILFWAFIIDLKAGYSDAIKKLDAALSKQPNFARARREMVIVLQYMEEYGKAFELAKQNYENDITNPYHIQAYLNCLLKDDNNKKNNELIKSLLSRLEDIKSETAHEMYLSAKAEYLAFHQNNEQSAIDFISEAKRLYPGVIYPKLKEFDIYLKFNNIAGIKKVIDEIDNEVDSNSYFYNSYIRRKCICLAKTVGFEQATTLMNKYLSNYTERAKERLLQVLHAYSQD